MLNKEETQKQLDKFRKYVIQQAKSNLSKSKKNSSKKLYDSINGVSKVNPNSISLYFEMLDYGVFQDNGVSGLKKKHNTPYSFKKGVASRQMLANLDKWIVRKGIAPRDAKGRLMNRQGLKFAIAKSIFNKGIKPSLFFTKPFEEEYKKLEGQLDSVLFKDAEDMIQFIAKQNK